VFSARRLRSLLAAAAFALVLVPSADAGRRQKAPPTPEVVEKALVMAPSDRLAAIALLESAASEAADPASQAIISLWAGEQRRLIGDTAVSRAWFEAAAAAEDKSVQDASTLGLALLNAQDGLSGNVVATLQLLGEAPMPDSMNADRFRLLALDGVDQGTNPSKIREYVRKAVAYAAGDPTVEGRVKATLAPLMAPGQADELESSPEAEVDAEEDTIKRAREALRGDRLNEAARIAQQLLDTWPESEHVREAEYIIKRAETGDRATAGRVGVLLPTTGKYAAVGSRIRQVIELANDRMGGRLQLVFRDAHGDVEATTQAVEDLVMNEGVVAILGPLLKEDAMAAAETAQALGTPMVALAQSEDPASAGEYVFRGFLPVEQQIAALVKHATGMEGMRRFAVLYPDTRFGQNAREVFEAEAKKRGAAVVRAVPYDATATIFLDPARQLGAKDYSARSAEFYRLKREAERRGQDPSKVVLPPTMDFDAIFIPDSWQRVALVASSLAYEEFPVGDFRPSRHAQRMPLLGLNAWNDKRIIDVGGDYVQHAVFVDAFYTGSNAPGVREFVSDHRQALGRKPGVIDALTWDATRLLATAVLAGGPDRQAVREELEAARLPSPVAGGARFGDDREVARDIQVLTIDGDSIRAWQPPALTPEGEP
jgi:ABC-type branched-subunit amino acid transport system substrate-binding protein